MFSSLQQGSLIYILDKTDGTKFKIGEVVSVSSPQPGYSPQSGFLNQSCINLKVNLEGNTYEYNQIPSSASSITYNNNRLTLSETKQGLQQEVETILQNSKKVIDNIEIYKQNVQDCENILRQLNPQFAKDKERDERLDALEFKFSGVESKIDKLINMFEQ